MRLQFSLNAKFSYKTQLTLSAPAYFRPSTKVFFREFIASSVFMLERYIKRPFFREGFEVVFYLYKHEKNEKQAKNGVLRKLKHIFPNTYQRINSICSPA